MLGRLKVVSALARCVEGTPTCFLIADEQSDLVNLLWH
jgi:hypothetical protein